MTQTSKRYQIRAFDKSDQPLWIDPSIASSNVNADGNLYTDLDGYISLTCHSVRLGYPIDPETGRPITKHRKRIAYFRISDHGTTFEIYATAYGRKAGVRNYQMRRPSDKDTYIRIAGYPPISGNPYLDVHDDGLRLNLVMGEGDPDNPADGQRNTDCWGDSVIIICTAGRVFLDETEGSWCGWKFTSLLNHQHNHAMPGATREEAEQALITYGDECIAKYGRDITRW